jgi:hypothetical protein
VSVSILIQFACDTIHCDELFDLHRMNQRGYNVRVAALLARHAGWYISSDAMKALCPEHRGTRRNPRLS